MPPEGSQIAGPNVAELRMQQEAIAGEIFGSSTPAMLYPLEMAGRAYHATSYRGTGRLLLGQMAGWMPMGACRV
jgi:hypothetical protein